MRVSKCSISDRAFALLRCMFLKIIFRKKFQSKGLFYVGRATKFFLIGSGRIHLGERARLGDYVELQSSGFLSVGMRTTIGNFSRIVAFESISIGCSCAIASFVTILDHDHDYIFHNKHFSFQGYRTAPVTIGSNVWIGDKSTITKGVTVGDNVIIGANSLVNKDIPPNCIAVGCPCRPIRHIGEITVD